LGPNLTTNGLRSQVSREVAVEAHRFRRDFLNSPLARVRTHRPGRNPPPHVGISSTTAQAWVHGHEGVNCPPRFACFFRSSIDFGIRPNISLPPSFGTCVIANNRVAGSLSCALRLPVASDQLRSFNRIQRNSTSGPGRAGENRHYRGARHKRTPRTADRDLCAKWTMVGAAVARPTFYSNSPRLHVEHRNPFGISVCSAIGRSGLSTSAHHGCCANARWVSGPGKNCQGHGHANVSPNQTTEV
jgi:hypothetical protein